MSFDIVLSNLRPQTAAALEGYGLAGHVVGVFACEEDCHATDVVLRVCETAHRDALDGLFEEVREVYLPLLQAFGHGQRTDYVDSDAVGSPFCSRNA